MQIVFLLAVVAFAAVCNAQNHPLTPCKVDSDCAKECVNTVGVCSPHPGGKHCHCHDAVVSCKSDRDCRRGACGRLTGCCHNRDHCHCGESCGRHPY